MQQTLTVAAATACAIHVPSGSDQDAEASTRAAFDWLNIALFERSGLLDYASQARAHSQERSLTCLLAQLYLLREDFVLATACSSP